MNAGQVTALDPVRASLLGQARREAGRLIADAHREADAIVATARAQAEETIRRARRDGRSQAASLAAAERSRGREQARSIVLGARRDAWRSLREQIAASTALLRDEPEYPALLGRLSALAAAAAGPGARLAVSPAGGVVARSGPVLVDCSLPRVAERAADALGGQVRELWAP